MTYFYTEDWTTVQYLANVLATAAQQGQAVRIDVDDSGRLKIKRGGGMWTRPFPGDTDPVRDLTTIELDLQCTRCGAWDGSHFRDCDS